MTCAVFAAHLILAATTAIGRKRTVILKSFGVIEVPYWWDQSKAKLEQIIELGPRIPSMPELEAR